jgi:hypothetical protein
MEGLFYCFASESYPTFHLLRFYENGYVLAKSIQGESIGDVAKELKRFALSGHRLIGEPELVYWGAYAENGDRLSFKIENELTDPSDTWSQYDLLTFKGTIVSPDELQLDMHSKRTQQTTERNYQRVEGNSIGRPA